MTLPNKITFFRLLLTIAAITLFYGNFNNHYWWSLLFFIVSMFLDFLDGYLARKLNQVTNLGAYLDPLVDKITIISLLICLVDQSIIPAYLAILLIFRDISVTSFRNLALAKNIYIPAKISGKLKTLLQTLGVTLGLLTLTQTNFSNYDLGLKLTFYTLIIALIISCISGLLIIIRNYKKVFEKS